MTECYDTEAQNKYSLIPVSKANERAANYCKVSQCAIKKLERRE
jgi:hypothetical protein